MKKFLILTFLFLFIFGEVSYALSDSQKAAIKANRQMYNSKRKILNNELDKTIAEYETVLTNEKMAASTKAKKTKELETKINKINKEKVTLQAQYKKDKKAIKKGKKK